MYFSKNGYAVYNGVGGKAPEVAGIVEFVLKVTFDCKLQKKWGAGCTIAPQ